MQILSLKQAMKNATLCLVYNAEPPIEVLLGYKKVGFGQGKYTGFGGKIEPGEAVVEAAIRELTEETDLTVPDPESLKFAAILEFRFPYKRAWSQDVFVFTTHHWQGTPMESREMIPRWFKVEEIPYHQMWADARHWLPLVLGGEKFRANFKFRADNATVGQAKFTNLQRTPDRLHTSNG